MRFNLGVGGDQENDVMRFSLVIDAKSHLEDVYLGLESNGKPQELFWRREGMVKSVSGEADSGFLCVIVIDDLGRTVLSCPLHRMSLLYRIFIVCSARSLCTKEYSEQ